MQDLTQRLDAHRQALLSTPFPGFGHPLKPHYGFDPDYVPLNNGSFGACPNYVLSHYRDLLVEAERRPDTFLRVQYKPLLTQARQEVAQLVGCHVDDLVLVNNATSGVNAVLRGLNGTWKQGDAILVYETVYGACGKTAQYIIDSNSHSKLKLVKVALTYPLSHDQVIRKTTEAIVKAQEEEGLNIRIGIVDAISSIPGVLVPWQRIVSLFRTHSILSLVDGAHAVGQIPLNLKQADPDFFISNCHKWLSAHRGVAFLYTPPRNQHLSLAIPTSHDYLSPNLPKPSGPALIPTNAPTNYIATWEWTGTQDLSNYLTIPAALEFRRWMGGEKAIMEYNFSLAQKAGEIVSKILGNNSHVMEVDSDKQDEKLTAAMVNVSIPISVNKETEGGNELAILAAKLQTRLTTENDTFVMFYVHADKIWIRLSAQVWLEESDFVWVAGKIRDLVLEEELAIKATV
ncbi:related to isopenicillin N epimerase [Ustilago trichophora]|uniref:Related to isopenicillin N epimerase n=1 Tax=Ustilago trichophora TaxID=86804 RepID=A0A5C3EC28_9BASI|nr:related to isopenicillin N epimerase [Ustilago trichophora]